MKKEEKTSDRRANVQNIIISTRKEKEELKLKSACKNLTLEECSLMKKITDSEVQNSILRTKTQEENQLMNLKLSSKQKETLGSCSFND